jgi:dinuclear metal center YbgI/SA1388 family protein
MTLKVFDITEIIETYAPLAGSDRWDNSGLQVGDYNAEVKVVAVALDADEANVKSAVDRDAELLITHHPLIFPSITSVDTRTGPGKAIAAAVTGNLSVYSSHTSLDHSASGTSFTLARRLSLTDIAPLPYANTPSDIEREDGVLVQGRLETPMKLVELAAFVKRALGAPMLRCVGNGERLIRSVAVCAGSGGDFVSTAASSGVDLLVLGEIRYHQALEACALGLSVIEAGHFWTEMPVVLETARILKEEACNKKWALSVLTIDGADPFVYP